MKEQPLQLPAEDLFEWGETKNSTPTESNSTDVIETGESAAFEPECPQCELGAYCSKHGGKKPYPAFVSSFTGVKSNTDSLTEDEISSGHLADLELERQRLEAEANRPLTPQELEEFFEKMNNELFGKAS
jgi:hypothetical protein